MRTRPDNGVDWTLLNEGEDFAEMNECEKKEIPGFIRSAFEIFSDPRWAALCGWVGDKIVIHKINEFAQIVLPRYYKHANYSSFVRQLNMYDFHKTVANPQIGEFRHEKFLKGRRDLLHLIKRKVRREDSPSQESLKNTSAKPKAKSSSTACATTSARGRANSRKTLRPCQATQSYSQADVDLKSASSNGHKRKARQAQSSRAVKRCHHFNEQRQDVVAAPSGAYLCGGTQTQNSGTRPLEKMALSETENETVLETLLPGRHFQSCNKSLPTEHGRRVMAPATAHFETNSSDLSDGVSDEDELDSLLSLGGGAHASEAVEAVEAAAGVERVTADQADQADPAWKLAVEQHLRACQFEIRKLHTENLSLRRCLLDTGRRMDALLKFSCSAIKANTRRPVSETRAEQLMCGESQQPPKAAFKLFVDGAAQAAVPSSSRSCSIRGGFDDITLGNNAITSTAQPAMPALPMPSMSRGHSLDCNALDPIPALTRNHSLDCNALKIAFDGDAEIPCNVDTPSSPGLACPPTSQGYPPLLTAEQNREDDEKMIDGLVDLLDV